MRRRLVGLAGLVALLLTLLPPATAPALAAQPDLTITSAARYLVDPARSRVHVTVDLTVTNHKPDTTTRRYYFDRASLAVPSHTSAFTVTVDGARPGIHATKRTADYTIVAISFGTKVFSGKSLPIRVTFDIVDPGGSPGRSIRVGQALVTFPIWAFGTAGTPGSTVEVDLPAGYRVSFPSGTLAGPTPGSGGELVYRAASIADPTTFFAQLLGDRPGAYAETTIRPVVGGLVAPVTIDAWTDDPSFGRRTGDLLSAGIPALGTAIGLPYPRQGPLVVQESISRSLGGYAGLFDPAEGRISVDFAADPFIVLHEAGHIWFNGDLLADRWADEGFASYYAQLVAGSLGLDAAPAVLTPELEQARIPLNAWTGVGEADRSTEAYAYAASLSLAQAIADRAGAADLSAVWQAAAARRSAYQPLASAGGDLATQSLAAAPDWRALLDLLETTTGRSFEDLWRTWVARPADAAALDRRDATRARYETTLAEAGSWQLPASIRSAMTSWSFDTADGLLSQASAVLDERTTIAARSAAAGLTPPPTLEREFEGTGGLRAAAAEGAAELAAIDAITAAAADRPSDPSPVEVLGLVGSQPEAELASAGQAFATGDLAAAVEHAGTARAAWTSAGDVGLRRGSTIAGALLLIGLVVGVAIARYRGRRHGGRRRRYQPHAHRTTGTGPSA